MKKTTFLKTLLMAVGLLVGASNAWGQITTTLAEYGTGEVAWSDSKAEDWTTSSSWITKTLITEGLRGKNKNGTEYLRKTISPDDGVILNISAEFNLFSNTGRNINASSSNAHGSYFRFGNIYIIQNSQNQSSYYSFSNCKSEGYTYTSFTYSANHRPTGYGNDGTGRTEEEWNTMINAAPSYYVEMEINTSTNTLTSFKVYPSSAKASTLVSITNQALTDADYSTIEIGFLKGSSMGCSSLELLKSLKITQTTQSTAYADYTVHFVDNNGATVKPDEVRSGEVGTKVNANSDDMTTFYSGGNKYIYASDGGGVEVVKAGTAEMTVTYTKYGQFTYNVYAVNSSDVKLQNDPIATATTYVTESATLAWSKYINVGGTWYVSSESTFRTTAAEAGSKNVVYTETDAIDYFFEFEDLEKSGTFAATPDGEGLSKNNSARFGKSSRAWTTAISAGTYTLNIYCYGENAKSPTLPMYYCDTDGSNLVYIGEATACRANNWELKEKTGVVIPEGKALCLYNTDDKNNSNYLVDYFTLTRTGDATVSKTITSAGWATYCSPYALDFTGDIANLTEAYIVTGGSEGKLTKTSVKGGTVPANTGLLLKGTAGTVTIPVVATGSTDVLANKLVGVTANTVIDAETGYVLMNDATYGLAFYKNKYDFTVGANTAYLPADFTGGGARFDSFSFDDETTGITQIENGKSNIENSVYNLNGQRVSKPKNGLYIVNGKKVIVK